MFKNKHLILLTVLCVSTNSFPAVVNPAPEQASQESSEDQSFWQKWTIPGILAGTCVILIATLAYNNVQLNRRVSKQAEKFEGQVKAMSGHSRSMKSLSENMKRSIEHHRGLTRVLKVINRRMIDKLRLGKQHRAADALIEGHDGSDAGDALVERDDIGQERVGGPGNHTVDEVLSAIEVELTEEDGGEGVHAGSPTLDALDVEHSMTVRDVTSESVLVTSFDGDTRELVVPPGGLRLDEQGRLVLVVDHELTRI